MPDSLNAIIAGMSPSQQEDAKKGFTDAYRTTLNDSSGLQSQITQIYNGKKNATGVYDETLATLTGVRSVVSDAANTGSKTMDVALNQLKITGNSANSALDAATDAGCNCRIGNLADAVGNKKQVGKALQALGVDPKTIKPTAVSPKDTVAPVQTAITSAGAHLDTGIPVVMLPGADNGHFVANIIRVRPVGQPDFDLAGVTGQNTFTIPDNLTTHYVPHEVKVTSVNKDGVESAPYLDPITHTYPVVTPGDPNPPLDITGLSVVEADDGFSANWVHSASPDVAQYVLDLDTVNTFTTNAGHCSTAGTTVTRIDGLSFTGLTGFITINGVQYAISGTGASNSLTLLDSAGSQTNVPFIANATQLGYVIYYTENRLTAPGYMRIRTIDNDGNSSTGSTTITAVSPIVLSFSYSIAENTPVGLEVGPKVLVITTTATRPVNANTYTGTVVASTDNTVTLDAGASTVEGYYSGEKIKVGSDVRTILEYFSATKICTVDSNWTSNPAPATPLTISDARVGPASSVSWDGVTPQSYSVVAPGTLPLTTPSYSGGPISFLSSRLDGFTPPGTVTIVTSGLGENGDNSQGTCDTNGTAVTWVSGRTFTGLSGILLINGVQYTILSVTDSRHLVLTGSAGVQSAVVFSTVYTQLLLT